MTELTSSPASPSAAIGPITMRLPPDPALSRVLRLAASGIATMAGFTVDEIEDIKIAISEVLLALIEHGRGEPIEVELSVEGRAFNVRGGTLVDDFDAEHPDLLLCRTVLAGVCSHHGIALVEHRAQIWAAVTRSSIT